MGVGEWTRGPTIGRGSSATVSLAVDRLTGELLAVKSVGADRAAELKREQSILSGLSSPYVVRCLGSEVSASADGSGGYDMLMEYAPGGSLADEIRRRGGRCEESLIRSRARDILRGLAHAHAAGVAHCDVKARNVLIGSDGRAMIADFGCARQTKGGGIAGEHRVMGTPAFMAPEAARGEAQGPAADVWALGCTVIEMATGAAPWQRFGSAVAMLHHVAFSGEAPELPPWLSEEGKDFLGRCLLQHAEERWSAEQLLEHEFLAFAAASSSSSVVTGIAEKEMFVSPKSVLDQALWDDDDTTADTPTACPIDRVRGLAAGAPDWTWDASWIAVHSSAPSSDDDNDEPAMSAEPEMDTDTDRDSSVGTSSTSAGSSNSQASHADGDGYDGTGSCNGERRDDCNHVISRDCTAILPITSNGLFSDSMLLFVPAGSAILPRTFSPAVILPVICFSPPLLAAVPTSDLTRRECEFQRRANRPGQLAALIGGILFGSCVARDWQQLVGGRSWLVSGGYASRYGTVRPAGLVITRRRRWA